MTADAIKIYVDAYSRPGAMTAGFNYYRSVAKNRAFAEEHKDHKFEVPVMAFGGEFATADNFMKSLQHSDPNVGEGIVIGSGHYIPEEAPNDVGKIINEFSALSQY